VNLVAKLAKSVQSEPLMSDDELGEPKRRPTPAAHLGQSRLMDGKYED